MPLLKLWNTIRGRANPSVKPEGHPGTDPVAVGDCTTAGVDAIRPTENRPSAAKPNTAKPKRSPLTLFGGASGPHAALCKSLRGIDATSVLDISVGDGSRSVAVVAQLVENAKKRGIEMSDEEPGTGTIRYIAVDQFEMAGGTTTLKQFHQNLRAAALRPQVVPEPIERALVRVAHTFGAIDLILIGETQTPWQTPEVIKLIDRIRHPETRVWFQSGEVWQEFASDVSHARRAA